MNYSLAGRAAVITGASQGLGFEIAKAYVQCGANVFLVARTIDDLKRAAAQLEKWQGPEQKVFFEKLDVSDEKATLDFSIAAIKKLGRVDVLVNNAGIYGPIGPIEATNWTEWKRAVEINVFGSILMARAFLPHFKKNRRGKIIQLSGGGATNPLPNFTAYAASKAAIVRFMESIALECKEFNIDINSIAPGALNTRLLDQVLDAGEDAAGEVFYKKALVQKESGGAPIGKGAELCCYLASEQSDGVTGRLISAIWDHWEKFVDYGKDLSDSDVYTLRRIVAKDRGFDWDK